jgi:hypothetical protein
VRLSEKSLVQSDKALIGEAKIPSGLNHDDDTAVGRLRERLGFIVMLHQPLCASKKLVGEMAERSIASVLKTEGRKRSVGSNPTLSSI